ncbi:25127_t:CDS:2 [Gigaspora rosea]|nr:25127_t:CDS:2 [Gigaspora rosea]
MTENDTNDNMRNIKSGENIHLLLNLSTQEIDNNQNNNKEQVPEISPKSSGSSQHRTNSSGDPLVNEVPCKVMVQVIKDQAPTMENQESPQLNSEWHSAPKVCCFCDQKGYIKKECSYFQESPSLRNYYRELKEAKLEKVNHKNIPDYEKPDAHTQNPDKESETINTNAISQREVIVVVDNMIKTPTPSNGSNSPNIDEDLHDELTIKL